LSARRAVADPHLFRHNQNDEAKAKRSVLRPMVDDLFFEGSREQSQIKSRIVSKYFWAWAKVIIPTAKKREGRIA